MYFGFLSHTGRLIDKICEQWKIDVTQGKRHRVVFDEGANIEFLPAVEN